MGIMRRRLSIFYIKICTNLSLSLIVIEFFKISAWLADVIPSTIDIATFVELRNRAVIDKRCLT